jgi:hypothetical protein
MCNNEPLLHKIMEVFIWIALFGIVDQLIAKYFNTFNKKIFAYFILFIISFIVYYKFI